MEMTAIKKAIPMCPNDTHDTPRKERELSENSEALSEVLFQLCKFFK